ncbi:MAG: transcriptional regulator [Hyphomicrobiales bacterium]|nr:helix-turn-helix transcriptional regulator [Hyphomicrobiales bacterium]PCJ93332.1 MAG: transcriptional regulator [Hyphomicrobiales bacterium]
MAKTIHSTDHVKLRELLRYERKSRDLTQHDIAQRLQVYKSYVTKYETGERRIDVIEYLAIAKAIGCDPYELLRQLNGISADSS